MLKNSFYFLLELRSPGPTLLEATVRLNGQHPILDGHFPGQPVVPGVCMLQIIKDCLEETTGRTLVLQQAGSIKFLQMLVPAEFPVVEVSINFESSDAGILVAAAAIRNGTTSFLKVQRASYA